MVPPASLLHPSTERELALSSLRRNARWFKLAVSTVINTQQEGSSQQHCLWAVNWPGFCLDYYPHCLQERSLCFPGCYSMKRHNVTLLQWPCFERAPASGQFCARQSLSTHHYAPKCLANTGRLLFSRFFTIKPWAALHKASCSAGNLFSVSHCDRWAPVPCILLQEPWAGVATIFGCMGPFWDMAFKSNLS